MLMFQISMVQLKVERKLEMEIDSNLLGVYANRLTEK